MTPKHSPKVEAELIEMEAIRVAHHDVVNGHGRFIDFNARRSYRRDVANHLAKRYNALLDKYEAHGLPIAEVSITEVEDVS